jgi:PAS domain S-box-containing protein
MDGPFPVGGAQEELLAILKSLSVENDGCESPFCLFQKDRAGRILWVNERYCAFVDRPAEEIVGRTDFDLYPAAFAQKYRDDDLRVMAEERPFRTFESIRTPDGGHRLIHVVKVPHREGGRVAGVLGAFWASALRSDAEERLRQSEERLRAIIAHMPVMLAALDSQGRVAFWNRECERVTGFAAGEIVGRDDGLARLYPDENYLRTMMGLLRSGGGPAREWEWRLTCKDGARRTVAWTGVDEAPPVPGWASWALGVDVTEKRFAFDVLDAIRTLQARYIARAGPAELFGEILDRLLAATGSAYGVVGEVLHRPSARPYL